MKNPLDSYENMGLSKFASLHIKSSSGLESASDVSPQIEPVGSHYKMNERKKSDETIVNIQIQTK